MERESPEYVKISLAAAMTLGLARGRFWRDAKMTCVNLLLHYSDGCKANCAYCGLSRSRIADERTFIRVPWPVHAMDDIIAGLQTSSVARRTCISMVVHFRAIEDTLFLTERLVNETPQPVSVLLSPTITDEKYLKELQKAGVDKIGIAIDAASPEIFEERRGAGVTGPHKWDVYWQRFEEAIEIFGKMNVGMHIICGLGETEQDLVRIFQRVKDMGACNHLFSFYPEQGTGMGKDEPPPLDFYRRVQIACHLIDDGYSYYQNFDFDPETEQIIDFGVSKNVLDWVIDSGKPFMTRGCRNCGGKVDCNRPYGNSRPGPEVRNYPFEPTKEDIALIRQQLNPKPRRKRSIVFSVPNTKQFHSDSYSNRNGSSFIGVSVTGTRCHLLCSHCEAKLLAQMPKATTPEALWEMARNLAARGGKGMLISGGCSADGILPIEEFSEILARIKRELGLLLTVHTKLANPAFASALAPTGVDAVMVDIVNTDVLQKIYHLKNKTIEDIKSSLLLLEEHSLPISPHILLGLNEDGKDSAELLDILKGRRLKSLVIVFLMPLPHTAMAGASPMPLTEVNRFFDAARSAFPEIPLYLGCAKPAGNYQKKLEMLALKHGFDGIAFPGDEIVKMAQKRRYAIRFDETCCALITPWADDKS
ncbi:MAG TPA: radical SAM protein [Candidatus Sumerlaeota bacterium]|nr:MAG: biotin synthase [candidate division BRC1 bacterium ADurb.Bin183]HOE64089.1 radical SAM protein [Candidatus Sumerlaeota bacterium]HRR30531.1 radical SAM protein [Candidatus Sumerlaeia bacterium]HON49032.1 radical SAM protein [Candidatus Sumerlaeota bacterium]HOR64360.1 radical SAM protein [Candidatus Sumerlaeota bacterium]